MTTTKSTVEEPTRLTAPTYVLGKGGPTLLDLRLESPEMRILITGPGMLYEKLRLLTSLGVSEGCHYRTLQALAGQLSATALCGAEGTQRVPISVVGRRTSAVIEIQLGPDSMYQNELVLTTTDGTSLRELLDRTIAEWYDGSDYVVALEPIPADGHLERHQHHDVLSREGGPMGQSQHASEHDHG